MSHEKYIPSLIHSAESYNADVLRLHHGPQTDTHTHRHIIYSRRPQNRAIASMSHMDCVRAQTFCKSGPHSVFLSSKHIYTDTIPSTPQSTFTPQSNRTLTHTQSRALTSGKYKPPQSIYIRIHIQLQASAHHIQHIHSFLARTQIPQCADIGFPG